MNSPHHSISIIHADVIIVSCRSDPDVSTMELELTPRPDDIYLAVKPVYVKALRGLIYTSSGLSLFGACVIIGFHALKPNLWPKRGMLSLIV